MAEDPAAELRDICTRGQGGKDLHDVSLEVHPGEILTLLGPAGAGKTMALRVLAGFTRPRSGLVLVDGADVTRVLPVHRRVVLVERELGLFADMTTEQTLRFVDLEGRRVERLLRSPTLADLAGLRAAAMSDGQRARLAVARALATKPRALLLDDIGAGLAGDEADRLWDLLLAARADGLGIIDGLGILYATRDPARAMALGDRMAVIAGGRVRQTGIPQALYDDPADAVVASATGRMNVLPGTVLALEDDAVRVRLDSGAEVDARARETTADALRPGGRCLVCVRPERLAVSILSPDQFGEGAMPAVVAAVSHLGPYGRLDLLVGGTAVLVVRPAGGIPPGVVAGRTISVAWQPHHAIAYPAIAPPA